MNSVLGGSCLLLLISCAAGQFFNGFGGGNVFAQNGRGAFEQAASDQALSAGQQDAINSQAALDAARREQVRLDALDQAKARQQANERLAKQQQLAIDDIAQAENFGNFAATSNLDAANSVNAAQKTGIQIVDESVFNDKSALSFNEAGQLNLGDRAFAASAVDFADFANADAFFGQDAFANNAISANAADENLLSAAERNNRFNDAFLNAKDFNQQAVGFNDRFFGQGQGGGGFNNNFFGRKRR